MSMGKYLDNLINRRINRTTYATGFFLTLVVYYPILFSGLYYYLNFHRFSNFPEYIEFLIVLFLLFLPLYILSHRRYHDLDIESFTFHQWFYLFLLKGQPKRNKYGDPPKPGLDLKGLIGF